MPRISPRLIKRAHNFSPLLPPLLKANPNFDQAKQELRWIQNELPPDKWLDAVKRRSRLEPLQYILGSQPFGSLDILCRKGVLIPRWETEEWVLELSKIIGSKFNDGETIKILDACTGSGCIPLLLNYEIAELRGMVLDITGFDFSQNAYDVSLENLKLYMEKFKKSSNNVKFLQANLFDSNILKQLYHHEKPDLIVSNPPYIPLSDYNLPVALNGIEKSVRNYEPSLALIGENEFYNALVQRLVIPSNAKGFVFEVGYINQVRYVTNLLKKIKHNDWQTGMVKDGAGNIRCVIGWLSNSNMTCLKDMCDEIYKV